MERITVEHEYVAVERRYVSKGEYVLPGMPMLDIRTPSGIVETLYSSGKGEIEQIEGKLARAKRFSHLDGSDPREAGNSDWIRLPGMEAVYPRGANLCQVRERATPGVGTAKGLTPVFSRSLAERRRNGAVSLRHG